MKKIIFFFAITATTLTATAQTFVKHGSQLVRTHKAKFVRPVVSVTFDTAVTYEQLNIQTSYVPIQYTQGAFKEIEGVTLGFSLSKMLYKAQAKITITVDGDTLYEMSSKAGLGSGITVMENFKTGKILVGPSIVIVADRLSINAGVAFSSIDGLQAMFKSTTPFIGIATSIENLKGFINNSTKIKAK